MSLDLKVLALALLPAGGNLLGSLLAEWMKTPQWVVGAALHAAAGIAIAVVSIDLMPLVLKDVDAWLHATAFAVGAGFSVLLSSGTERLRKIFSPQNPGQAGAWMVYIAVAADLFSDGLMTGAGSAVSSKLGFALAISQLVANIPGGFAAAANFRSHGASRTRRYLLAASLPLPALISAALGSVLLSGAGKTLQSTALAVIMGILLLATVEDTLPQGDAPHPRRWISTSSFAGGFALFVLLSAYLR